MGLEPNPLNRPLHQSQLNQTAPPIATRPARAYGRPRVTWSQHRDPHVVSPPPIQPSRDSTSETKSTVHRNPANHTGVTPGTPSSVIFSDLLVTTWPNRTLATGIHRFLNHNHRKTTSNKCIEGLRDSVAKSHCPKNFTSRHQTQTITKVGEEELEKLLLPRNKARWTGN